MKKLYTLIAGIVFFINTSKGQDVSVPEGPFKAFLMTKYPECFVNQDVDGHFLLNSACTSITTEDSLEFHFLTPDQPIDLDGIQYFISLKYLNCSGGRSILSSPALPASLEYLNFSMAYSNVPFGTLPDILPNGLRHLNCSDNYLSGLGGHFPDSLRYLDCSQNSFFTTLPVLPSRLDTLICGSQRSVSPNSNILTSLPALPATLTYLNFADHALGDLPVLPAGLKYLNCSAGNVNTNPETIAYTLHTLAGLPDGLEYLSCSSNGLTSISNLPASLTHLDCAYSYYQNFEGQYAGTGITYLGPLPSGLTYLDCHQAALHCLPVLPAALDTLVIDRDSINCLPNSGTYTVAPVGPQIPLCTVTNNSYQCVFMPVISGRVYYDNNSNGILDAGENFRSGVAVTLQNGTQTFSNADGYFELSGTIGLNTITVTSQPYYNSVPPTSSYTITGYDEVVNADYALQPNTLADSVRISIIPYNTARRGFDHYYLLNYENVGTTTVSSAINFNYNPAKLTYTSASIAGIADNGSSLTLNLPAFAPGVHNSFFVHFTVNAAANLGDTIFVNGTATANANTGRDSAYSVIRGSFDPNDKQATPQLTPQQVSAGDFINYTIRFQNTGTDTAFNIVLTDTLSSLLIAGSVQIISTSHPCKLTRTGNAISFELLNILLPDSNTNELASHGYVQFRIKPQPGAVLNTVIPNQANIYFDYNSPVITNIANTFIQLTTVPLNLLSFKGYITGENRVLLLWNMANENNVDYFNVESSLDGFNFTNEGNVQANGTGAHSYSFQSILRANQTYYRLKIFNVDGKSGYSPVVLLKHNGKIVPGVLVSNPAQNSLNLIVTDNSLVNTSAVMFSASGQLVKQIILVAGLQEINIKDLAPGTYYLKTKISSQAIIVR